MGTNERSYGAEVVQLHAEALANFGRKRGKTVNPALVSRPHVTELKLPHSTSPKPDKINGLPAGLDDFDDVDLDEAVPTRPLSARPMAKVSRIKVKR
jgi:hypothetical protein